MNRILQFIRCRGVHSRKRGEALSDPQIALAGAVLLALAHYTFGEWVFHPGLALWRERAFWADMPWVAAVPVINWLVWVVVSLGRVNAARPLFLAYAVVLAGDCLWYPARQYAPLIGTRVSPDYWYWWTYWLPLVLVVGNVVIARQWWKEMRSGAAVPAASTGGVPPPDAARSEMFCEPATPHPIRIGSPRPSDGRGVRGEGNASGEGVQGVGEGMASPKRQLTWLETGLRLIALFLGSLAILLTAVHLVPPRWPVNDFTLDLAAEFLVRPEQKSDFEFVLQNAPCRGKRLGAVLQHVELANLQRNQFYPDLDASTFQQFILSPVVDNLPLQELDWRRALWENFYPRVRRESDPASAAHVVVRFLRERVGLSPDYPYRVGVETIWTQGMTDEPGFDRIYVAALRSVGIAARLNGNRQAELLTNGQWQPAPRPLLTSF